MTYIARTRGQPKAGDDVKNVVVVPFDQLPHISLAFDHRAILDDYLEKRRREGGEEQLAPSSLSMVHQQKKMMMKKKTDGLQFSDGVDDGGSGEEGELDTRKMVIQRDTCS